MKQDMQQVQEAGDIVLVKISKRLVLRTHGTVLSAKQLINAKNPSRYFGVIRCFRYDQVDATHGVDFYQTEGIVIEDGVSIKTLLGLLEIFAKSLQVLQKLNMFPHISLY